MARRKKPTVLNPSDPVLWCKEAASRMEAGENKEAIYCYQESLKLRPEVADVWFNLGCLFEKDGDETAALGCYTTASKMFLSDYRFPAERARLLAMRKQYSDAVDTIEDAISINPHSPVLLSNKAGYLVFAKRAEEAVEAADQALVIDPTYTAAYLHKAHALTALGKGGEALEALAEAEDDPRVLKMRSTISIQLQKFDEGRNLAQQLIEMTPEDAEAWSILGVACAHGGDTEGAVSALEQAVKLNPKEKSYKANLLVVKKMK